LNVPPGRPDGRRAAGDRADLERESAGRWVVERRRGPAGALHAETAALLAAEATAAPVVRVLEVESPALVLGSAQPATSVDTEAAAIAGVQVVRRRSGGGAVLLTPGSQVWIDVVIPSDDPAWESDIRRAARAVGAAWAAAIDGAGAGPALVWSAGMRRGPWSAVACFGGVGPGEILVASRKVVGISQRRTRAAAAFQTTALLDWDPAPLVRLLRLSPADRRRAEAELGAGATGLGRAGAARLEAGVVAALTGGLA
jgi:lipoate-protein ligase A